MWLLIHTGIKVNPCQQNGQQVFICILRRLDIYVYATNSLFTVVLICIISICLDTYIHIHTYMFLLLLNCIWHITRWGLYQSAEIRTGIRQSITRSSPGRGKHMICWPTQLKLNPINGVSSNVQKFLCQSEDRKRWEFSEARPKVNQSERSP